MTAAALVDCRKPADAVAQLEEARRHPTFRRELGELLEVLEDDRRDATFPWQDSRRIRPAPLHVHARYRQEEVLAALGAGNGTLPRLQAGVYFVERENVDVLFVTLKKSESGFSPSTMYRDFAMSPTRFHWETQNTAHPGSGAGRRYLEKTSTVLLFVREYRKQPNGVAEPYCFLGPVTLESASGEAPDAVRLAARACDAGAPVPARDAGGGVKRDPVIPAERGASLRDHPRNLRVVGHVGLHRDRATPRVRIPRATASVTWTPTRARVASAARRARAKAHLRAGPGLCRPRREARRPGLRSRLGRGPMTPKEVVRAFHAAFVARDVDALCALYAEDAVSHQVAEAPLRGKAAIRRSVEEFFRAFPGETTEVLNLFQDGEWAMWEWRGGNPNAPTGAPVVHGCGFFHVRDGLIVFQRGYWDMLTFLRAHGLPPPK